MPFAPVHLTAWRQGCILVGEPDAIPDDALRRAVNVRTDRLLGTITVRPGWTRQTSSAIAAATPVLWIGKLYGDTGDWSYAQLNNGNLYRLTDAWLTPVSLITAGTSTVISAASLPDGNQNPHLYLVNGTIASKDDGSLLTTMGIAPPTAAPLSAALATDLTTTINVMDDHTQWTGTDVTGKADETNIKQEGTGSVTFAVAASTLGSIAHGFAAPIDLDTLTDGDDVVKDDDYIHVWLRFDRPDFLSYVQIDIDLDTSTVANAFRDNYYSVRLPALTWINQGRDQWTKVQVRKSQFARFGTTASKDWEDTNAIRISVLTTSQGAVTVYVDDLKLRGGIDLEGDIDYTLCYRNSTTDARGNPPKDTDFSVLYTTKLAVDRQRVNVTISNVIEGGANHPGDAHIDKLLLFRRGGAFGTATLAASLDDTASSPYLDATSDNTLLLQEAVTALETDNDVPPTGTSRVLFGPDAQGVLFMIVDGKRIYYSKAYEDGENRAENWGRLNFFLAGDGTQPALAGLTRETERFFWTHNATFQIVGAGINTFLPVEIPGSRGIVGQHAVASGDGRLFFRAQDGIYEQRGLQQVKLTGTIDPLFNNEVVDGQRPETFSAAARAQARLMYHPDPHGGFLVMLYCEAPATVPTAMLILKRDAQSGLHTQAFFDTSSVTDLRSLLVDEEDLTLLAGGADGHVYRIEDHGADGDAGSDILIHGRTKSVDGGLPAHDKHLAQITAQGSGPGDANLTATAYYDRNGVQESLGTGAPFGTVGELHFRPGDPTAARHDVAFDFTLATRSFVSLSRITMHLAPLPENTKTFDTDDVVFADLQRFKLARLDIEASANLTITVYSDGVVRDTRVLIVTATRALLEHRVPAGLKGHAFRMHMTSTAPFRLYAITGHFKPLGAGRGYQRVAMMGA